MNYNEYLTEASKLEKQAADLRKKADEAKKAEQEKELKKKKANLEENRYRLSASVMNYYEAVSGKKLTEEQISKLHKVIIEVLTSFEKEYDSYDPFSIINTIKFKF